MKTHKPKHTIANPKASHYPNKCVCGEEARLLEDWITIWSDGAATEICTYSVRCSRCKLNTPWYHACTSAVNRWNSMEVIFTYDPDSYEE